MNIFIYIICYKIKTFKEYFLGEYDRQIDIHLTIAVFFFEYWEHTKKEIKGSKWLKRRQNQSLNAQNSVAQQWECDLYSPLSVVEVVVG